MSEEEHSADTLPPDPISELFDGVVMLQDMARELRQPDPSGRPRELFVRWRVVEGGVEIFSCTTAELPEACAEGEFQGVFR